MPRVAREAGEDLMLMDDNAEEQLEVSLNPFPEVCTGSDLQNVHSAYANPRCDNYDIDHILN